MGRAKELSSQRVRAGREQSMHPLTAISMLISCSSSVGSPPGSGSSSLINSFNKPAEACLNGPCVPLVLGPVHASPTLWALNTVSIELCVDSLRGGAMGFRGAVCAWL